MKKLILGLIITTILLGFSGCKKKANSIVPNDVSSEKLVLEKEDYIEVIRDTEPWIYFANLQGIPEFSDKNEGSMVYKPEERIFRFTVTKITGTETGSPDGPTVSVDVDLVHNKIIRKEFIPAPDYTEPNLIELRREILDISDQRLLEIANILKDIFDKELGYGSKEDLVNIGADLIKNETIDFLHIGLSANEVVERLGEPDQKSEATEWGSDGLIHQQWIFSHQGLDLDIITNAENNQVVNRIIIEEPSNYRTKNGIGIGSARQEVIDKYDNKINNQDSSKDSIVIGSIYGGIKIELINNKVARIILGVSAE